MGRPTGPATCTTARPGPALARSWHTINKIDRTVAGRGSGRLPGSLGRACLGRTTKLAWARAADRSPEARSTARGTMPGADRQRRAQIGTVRQGGIAQRTCLRVGLVFRKTLSLLQVIPASVTIKGGHEHVADDDT
jgi:hypothetical protein